MFSLSYIKIENDGNNRSIVIDFCQNDKMNMADNLWTGLNWHLLGEIGKTLSLGKMISSALQGLPFMLISSF